MILSDDFTDNYAKRPRILIPVSALIKLVSSRGRIGLFTLNGSGGRKIVQKSIK